MGAGDDAAGEGGVVSGLDVEALVAGTDTALLDDAGVVAVDLALASAEAAAHLAVANGDAAAYALPLTRVGAGVLQALYGEDAADVGGDARGGNNCAFESGVVAVGDVDLLPGGEAGVGPRYVAAFGAATCAAGAGGEEQAVGTDGDADATAFALVGGVLIEGAPGGEQGEVVVGVEGEAVAGGEKNYVVSDPTPFALTCWLSRDSMRLSHSR